MMKLMRFDSSRELSSIKDELVSQSNTRQRIGRAGRVQKGEYFSMLPLKVKLALPLSITTEIQRSDLQSTVLQLKAMHFDAKEIIKAAPEAPDSSKIIDSITRLENIGALDSNGHLTSKGLLMSKLPMTPWISNLIIQGIIYKCLDPLLTIAAILSCDRTPFQYHPTQVIEARQYIRKNYALGSNSDQLTALNAIKYVTQRPDFDQLKASDFDQMFLKRATVQNIIKAKAQYTQILEDAGILVPSYDFDRFSSNVDYIKAIFGKSLLRNVAELAAKNVYKGKYFQMRLTGSSVNSYGAQGQEEEEDTQIEGQDKIFDEAHVNEDDSLWDFSRTSQSIVDHSSVTFAKLLVYQELHQVDRLMFMRNTSEITPLSVVLFSNSARISSGNRTEISTESGLRIGVSSFSVGKLLREFNQALIDYEDYVLTKLSDRHVNVVEGDALHDVLHQLVTNDRSAA